MMFIDTHAHLLDERFDADRGAVLDRARKAGAGLLLEVACEPGHWDGALAFARTEKDVRCILGVHPQEARLADGEALRRLEELCRDPLVVGIGETGLDYHYETSPRDAQKKVFREHVRLARTLDKPLVVHCRSAYPDLIDLLTLEEAAGPLPRGVVHCFSGTPEEAAFLTDRGLLLGIDGPVTYPGSRTLRETVAAAPLERLLLETDAPYLPPQPWRGERNEPAYLPRIAEEIARVKDVTPETVFSATTAAARNLFGL